LTCYERKKKEGDEVEKKGKKFKKIFWEEERGYSRSWSMNWSMNWL